MKKRSITPSNQRGGMNRSWGLIALKTAYRDRYPQAAGDIISENAQDVEEKLFEKATSAEGYDASIMKAYDTITRHESSSTDRSTTGKADSREVTASQIPTSTIGTNTQIQHAQAVMPRRDTPGRAPMTNRIESLAPNTNAARKHMPENEIVVEDVPNIGELDFCSTRIDASDVIMMVPFILEAGVQVIGKIKTIEQTQSITESQKSSIGFLGIEKMFRASYLASSGNGIGNASSRTQRLSKREQEQVLRRAKQLRKEYMNKIRKICTKLGELFDTPVCDKQVILGIRHSLKFLDEVESSTYQVSRQTVHILNYVENVFKSAIGQYRFLLNVKHLPRESFQASNRVNGDKRAGDVNRSRSHCDKAPDTDGETSYANLKLRYRDTIKELVPLVRAEVVSYPDAKKIREQMCYVTAFLNLDDATDRKVVRRAERTIQGFYERFRFLLRGESSKDQVTEKRILYERVSRKTNSHIRPQSMRDGKTAGYGLKKIYQAIEDAVHESEESDEESEEDEELWEDGFEKEAEKLRTRRDESDDDEEFETAEGQEENSKSNVTSDGDEQDGGEHDEDDAVEARMDNSVGRKDVQVELSDDDGETIGETDSETEDEEDDESEKQEEKPKRLPKEVISVKAEEEKRNEVSTEMQTPRRSQRASVVAARARRSSIEGTPSGTVKTPSGTVKTPSGSKSTKQSGTPVRTRSGTVKTPSGSKSTKQSSTPERTRTPGKGLRPRKTPLKK